MTPNSNSALLGVEVAEIATLTGHTLGETQSILDSHYLNRDRKMARKAIDKLEEDYFRKLKAGEGQYVPAVLPRNVVRFKARAKRPLTEKQRVKQEREARLAKRAARAKN